MNIPLLTKVPSFTWFISSQFLCKLKVVHQVWQIAVLLSGNFVTLSSVAPISLCRISNASLTDPAIPKFSHLYVDGVKCQAFTSSEIIDVDLLSQWNNSPKFHKWIHRMNHWRHERMNWPIRFMNLTMHDINYSYMVAKVLLELLHHILDYEMNVLERKTCALSVCVFVKF